MSVNENSFFQYTETRATSGYKAGWLVKLSGNDNKYSMISATESVPYVYGDKETFEFDILQSPTKGQVEGKMSLEPKDIDVLHHRDNAYRFGKLEGQVLDFMVVNSEYVGYKFKGTIDYRPQDAGAEIHRATVTITPMSATVTPIYNARPECIETLCLASSVPATVKVGETFDLSVTQEDAVVSVAAKLIADGTNEETDATASASVSDVSKVSISATGLYALTVSATGYASWTTTVYVEAN